VVAFVGRRAALRCVWRPALLVLAALFVATCGPPPDVQRPDLPLPEDADISERPSGRYGGVFVQSSAQEPKTFNPMVSEDTYSAQAIGLMQSALTDYDPVKEETVPSLAREWEIGPDNKVYTFHLRRGLRWSDGEPLTADDVIFTFDVVFDPRFPNRYAQQYTIAGEPVKYEKIDEHTVRFRTADVYAPFLNDIGFVSILPKHALQASFDDGTLQKQWTSQTAINAPGQIVGSGPFRLFAYRPGERMVMAPNPHYWRADERGQRLPYVDFYIAKFVPSANTETVLFATGQTDAADISVTDVAWVKRAAGTYDFTIYDRGPASGISFFWFNQHPGKDAAGNPYLPPYKLAWFRDPDFRRAVLMGLDRPGLVRAVYFGRAQPLDTIISPANRKWHNPDTVRYPYDPERAKALLEQAWFVLGDDGVLRDTEGHPVEFELLASEGSQTATSIGTTLIENMRVLGIKVTLSMLDFGTLVNRVSDTFDYDAAMMGFTGGGDPSGGKAIYRSNGRLHVWYPEQRAPATDWEARIDEIMDLQERTLDEAKRIELIHEMQAIFSEKLPLLFLITPNAYAGIRNKWQNVAVPALGPITWNLDEFWFEEATE
jgi:peptide/nickel transport system substrate-binding protein